MDDSRTTAADRERDRKARFSRGYQDSVSEIGPPKLTKKQREAGKQLWEECRSSLLAFNVKVFPNSSGLKPFGEVHQSSIAHDESVIVSGGRICKAEPRGFGKTTRTCNASLWGALYGYRRMIPVFSANLEKSKSQIMARWKSELFSNELLFWMFPDLIWPLRALENKPQRCASQTFNGIPTHVQWTADRIVFPHVPGVPGSGSALIALPLKSCRGATHTTADNEILRPDLVVFDDVQKDEDADNPNTIRKIEDLIDHTAMMLGGHSQTMSAIMNCTVRKPDDISETYLKKSGWRRVRYKMLESRATNEKLWLEDYAKIRNTFDPECPDSADAAKAACLKFYREHREEMDAGAVATWEWAYTWGDAATSELSAIQHAYNILIDLGESVFASECQNQPLTSTELAKLMPAADICRKQNGCKRGVVPSFAEKLVAFIDCQQNCLAWSVVAGSSSFQCGVVDYGYWPEQKKRYVERKKANPDFDKVYPGQQVESQLYAALNDLLNWLDDKPWISPSGEAFRLDLVMIDSGAWTKTVNLVCNNSSHRAKVIPSLGVGITASDIPLAMRRKSDGETHGHHFIVKKSREAGQRYVMMDVNFWKSKLHSLLWAGIGSDAYWSLYTTSSPDDHRMIADHYRAEYPVETQGRGRTLSEWKILPHQPENEMLDCAVGCLVGLMICGCGFTGIGGAPRMKPRRRPKVTYGEK